MLRKLVDYKKLDHKLTSLLIESYPYGYGDEDIIVFKNLKGEIVETVELKTKDTIYLVKISKSLAKFIADFDGNLEKELDSKASSALEEIDSKKIQLELDSESANEESE